MSIALNAAVIKHERRIRVLFTNTLASSAFTSTSYYTVTSLDGATSSPAVVRAFAVASSPHVVELQLADDLVQGAAYTISAVGVPATDLSTTPNPSETGVRMGREPQAGTAATARGPITVLEELLFGRDARWTGSDFAEAPSGDLDEISGLELMETDLTRRGLSNGLPWDPAFGLHAREFVNGSPTGMRTLRGRAIAQLLQDDRVASADAEVDLSNPEEPILEMRPTLIGGALAGGDAALQLRQEIG